MRHLVPVLAILALAGCAADRTVRDVTVAASAVQLACAEALLAAQAAALIPAAVVIAQGVRVGCATADGLARLAAEPTSAAWLGAQTQMLRTMIASTRAFRGVLPVLRIPGA